jgi:single-strand DNA-binding protein
VIAIAPPHFGDDMNEPKLTLVGVVTTGPTLNHTRTSGRPVANFKVTCTSRTFNRERNRWLEADSLTIRVVCWGRLAENVAASVHRGDPVVVGATLRARSYQATDGTRRWVYEANATAVGPDLTRGTAEFRRTRPSPADPEEADLVELTGASAALLGAALAAPDLDDPETAPAETQPETPAVVPIRPAAAADLPKAA